MPTSKLIFRAYDIRGQYPTELDERTAYSVGRAYARIFPAARNLVVARDVKKSSARLAKTLIQGLNGGGIAVVDAGIAPIGAMYSAICETPFDGGIMVTASHLPNPWNGFKAQGQAAYPVITEHLNRLRDLVLSEKFDSIKAPNAGSKTKNIIEDYINYSSARVKLSRPLKVVIDAGNGTVGHTAQKIFEKSGCQALTLYAEFDETFPHHIADPYEQGTLVDLQNRVLREGADCGFAFDLDADRVGVIDNRGRVVTGDQVLMALARAAVSRQKGPVVHEVRTSQAFIDDMAARGVATHFSVSHHKAVLDKMKEVGAVFGGETTSHFFFPLDNHLYDDGIFSALEIAAVIAAQKDFAAYVDTLPRYAISPEIFIATPDEVKFERVAALQKILKKRGCDFLDIDGARVQFKDGWALARAANTSPFIKVRFEGKTPAALQGVINRAAKLFKEAGIELPQS